MNLLVGVLVEVVRVVATAEQEGRVVSNLRLGLQFESLRVLSACGRFSMSWLASTGL